MKTVDKQKFNVIDIDNAISNSKLFWVKHLPKFAVHWLKKIVKQNELNALHNNNSDKMGIAYINGALSDLGVTIDTIGIDKLNSIGRYIFVANHPQGGADAMGFLSSIATRFPDVVSPSNNLLMHIPNLHPIIVGVNVFGVTAKQQAEIVNNTFKSDVQIMMFPAGLVSRKINGKIEDPEWNKGFITKAIQSNRMVVPVFISGRNSNTFYRIARLRKALGIKFGVEAILLPGEMMKNKNTTFSFYYGTPILPETFDKSKSHPEWALEVRKIVYDLKPKVN